MILTAKEPKYSSIFKQVVGKQERKGAELRMTYLGNLNNTNTNQSKIVTIVVVKLTLHQ